MGKQLSGGVVGGFRVRSSLGGVESVLGGSSEAPTTAWVMQRVSDR